MKRVFTSHDSAEVGLLKSLLEEAGIECFTRNETQAYVGAAFSPELWIVREEDLPAAEKICREWRQPTADQSRWKCETCGEELEGQFAACWKCGAPRTVTLTLGVAPAQDPVSEVRASETAAAPKIIWKPFPDFIVILLAIVAFVLEFYYRGVYRTDRDAALQYPVYTALWIAGQNMTLDQGWKDISGWPKWLRDRHEMRTNHDHTGYCEYILRDTIAFLQRSYRASTNTTRVRANLVVLLAESDQSQKYTNELTILERDSRASNFARAAHAVYRSNKNISISEIDEPGAILTDTWFRTRFDSRWSRLIGNDAESARLTNLLADEAAQKRRRHLAVIGVATTAQALGLVGLIWVFLARRHLAAFRQNLSVPWLGWEGLGIVFAAWALGILLDLVLRTVGLGTISHFGYSLVFWTPLVCVLWQRHGRHDSRPLKQLFLLSPRSTRGLALIAAGLAVFLLDWLAYRGVHQAAYALGFRSHWAEAVYEPRLYEPWNVRWILLLNAVLIGPIGEEILYRGVLFPALQKWFPTIIAAVLSAIVFAAPHYYGWPGFLALIAFGIVSALSVHFTGSLIPAIIGHIFTNLILGAGYSWVFGK